MPGLRRQFLFLASAPAAAAAAAATSTVPAVALTSGIGVAASAAGSSAGGQCQSDEATHAEAIVTTLPVVTDHDEGLELLQRRGARLRAQHVADEAALAAAQAAAATSPKRRKPSLFGSFRRLLMSCDNTYGTAQRCSDSIVSGAMDVFDVLEAKNKGEVLTNEELEAFRGRFKEVLTQESKEVYGHKFIWDRYNAWVALVKKCFTEMRPAISQALVKFVNANDEGWKAEYKPEMLSASVADFKQKLGLTTNSTEMAELLEEDRLREAEDLLQIGEPEEPQGPFDVREHWPECSDVTHHVRFQTCANCWSHSTALITESRVCIKSHGALKGRDAWLSQSYVAACRLDGMNYCAGGAGTLGFKTVTRWGVPTGASDSRGNADPEAKTCFPQIPPRLDGVVCPASCAKDTHYPRDLSHDTFYLNYQPRALHPRGSLTQLLAKRSLMEEGPIMVGFRAYQDLQAYVDGIYKPVRTRDNRSLGGHAVTAMGFGPGYYLCTNSWGDKWGIAGTFKIAVEAINIGYYLPGQMTYGKYGRFPVPVP